MSVEPFVLAGGDFNSENLSLIRSPIGKLDLLIAKALACFVGYYY